MRRERKRISREMKRLFRYLERIATDIRDRLALVQDLDLNTRIWSEE
jgi:hypothetical protein